MKQDQESIRPTYDSLISKSKAATSSGIWSSSFLRPTLHSISGEVSADKQLCCAGGSTVPWLAHADINVCDMLLSSPVPPEVARVRLVGQKNVEVKLILCCQVEPGVLQAGHSEQVTGWQGTRVGLLGLQSAVGAD